MIRTIAALLLIAATAGAAAQDAGGVAMAEVRTADGAIKARAIAWPTGRGLEVRIQAAGLAPGRYGAHLHAVGRCEGPDFASAGPHWNPTGRQHGSLNPQGHHLGDLPNLDVDESGAGRLEYSIPGAAASGAERLLDADGASVVIHAAPDDYRTDPSGNSGARIACGVLAPSR